jgi:hypothetical protein
MQRPWFKPWGWVHRPVGMAGWLLTLLALAVVAHVFRVVDARSHSASDTLIGVFPWAWIVFVTLNWVASRTSR